MKEETRMAIFPVCIFIFAMVFTGFLLWDSSNCHLSEIKTIIKCEFISGGGFTLLKDNANITRLSFNNGETGTYRDYFYGNIPLNVPVKIYLSPRVGGNRIIKIERIDVNQRLLESCSTK